MVYVEFSDFFIVHRLSLSGESLLVQWHYQFSVQVLLKGFIEQIVKVKFAVCLEDNVVYELLIEDAPAQEVDQSSVSPRLRGREEEEEDSGEEGRQRSPLHNPLWLRLMGYVVQSSFLKLASELRTEPPFIKTEIVPARGRIKLSLPVAKQIRSTASLGVELSELWPVTSAWFPIILTLKLNKYSRCWIF